LRTALPLRAAPERSVSAPVDPSYGLGLLFGDFVDAPSAPRVTVCVSMGFAGGIFGAEGVEGFG